MPAHFFWDVAANDPSFLLRPPISNIANSPLADHSTTALFPTSIPLVGQIDRVEAKVWIRPFAYSMIDALIASGDLDPSFRSQIPTLPAMSTFRTWTTATADMFTKCNPH
jgi:hypothetical protein